MNRINTCDLSTGRASTRQTLLPVYRSQKPHKIHYKRPHIQKNQSPQSHEHANTKEQNKTGGHYDKAVSQYRNDHFRHRRQSRVALKSTNKNQIDNHLNKPAFSLAKLTPRHYNQSSFNKQFSINKQITINKQSSLKNHSTQGQVSNKAIRIDPLDSSSKNNISHTESRKVVPHLPKKGSVSRQPVSVGASLKEMDYYIGDVKQSVAQYSANKEYVDSHLVHFMDSLSVLQIFKQTNPPRQTPAIAVPKNNHNSNKLTVVFDLDQTLIHSHFITQDTTEEEIKGGHLVQIRNGDCCYQVSVKIRPYVQEVLARLGQVYELGVFTASQEHYGQVILALIDPDRTLFSFRLYRHRCYEMQSKSGHVKDLRILERDLSRVVLVDNSPITYLFQKHNGIPIVSFVDDPRDEQMLKLQKFIGQLALSSDVRPALRSYFKLDQYHLYLYRCLSKLVRELY